MIRITDKATCSGCHACAAACPENCITMVQDDEGFLYPAVDGSKCKNCAVCTKICPILSPLGSDRTESPTAYAAFSKDGAVRLNSSSGGVFTHLASEVIKAGGVVVGAAFDEAFAVRHICIETADDLWKLRGSKYLQSTVGNSFAETKRFLESGRTVYYSGTPCQIAGLLKFLKKNYDNLITQDIICHGVPSPKVWNCYLHHRENAAKSKVKEISFRDKKSGWTTFSIDFIFENHMEFARRFAEDAYMKAFLANLSLRPSCYRCSFKGLARPADITLADFWGIQQVVPEMDDNKGTSLVFLHSEKGKDIFRRIEKDIVYQPVSAEKAVRYNSAAVQAVNLPSKRKTFMQSVSEGNFETVTDKMARTPMVRKVLRKTKTVIQHFTGRKGR